MVRAPQQTGRPASPNARNRAGAAAGAAAGVAAGAAMAPPPARAEPPPDPNPGVGSVTGLPVPRFVALRSDEVNLRIGPDTRFPIEWTYQRRDLPVEVLREYNQWRRIRDMDGTEGWVHQSTLAGRRTLVVVGQPRELRRSAAAESGIVAHLQPGVVGRIRRCAAGSAWCEVRIGDHSGWLRRSDFWGVAPDEVID
ncbi:SH3 domain-containing protein [Roseomonas marmotae]|uniref:SH3 domain-containing protein n=1 Tax=Roseomonas marmotae TaxID=2768161 RepID=UPI001EFF234F|nr:SH3 domain-containing protein [Roseomonas marmotae]